MIKGLLLPCVIFLNTVSAHAQNNDVYGVLRAVVARLDHKVLLLDSLFPYKGEFNCKGYDILTPDEKKELKAAQKILKGIKLVQDSLPSIKLKDSFTFYYAIRHVNDKNMLNVLAKADPCYMLSTPVFFGKSKALIFVGHTRWGTSDYVLEKKNGVWVIIAEIGLLYV